MKNIVYLLGAGASAQSIPLVANFNERLNIFYSFLHRAKQNNLRDGKILDTDLLNLMVEEVNHYSIDTLAKKYWLAAMEKEYQKVKALMICFFTYESFKKAEALKVGLNSFLHTIESEWGKNPDTKKAFELSQKTIDLRYDALLASIIKSPEDLVIPEQVKFISWNYDDQLEFAGNNIFKARHKTIGKMVNAMSSAYDELDYRTDLIKLNGGFVPNLISLGNQTVTDFYAERVINKKNIFVFDELYQALLNNPLSMDLGFAWELPLEEDNRIKKAKEFVKDATDLVIIGYTFPNYNVEVDQFLFGSANFETIYIEDFETNFDYLIDRLEYLKLSPAYLKKEGKLKLHKDLRTFCLPSSFYGIEPYRPYIPLTFRSSGLP